jgi:hypothetical protein
MTSVDPRYILECIVHKREDRPDVEFLPIRHYYGLYQDFDSAHQASQELSRTYETILIHILNGPDIAPQVIASRSGSNV